MNLLEHFFTFAETYAVCLVWVCVPLGFYASYLIMKNHFGMFAVAKNSDSEVSHGGN